MSKPKVSVVVLNWNNEDSIIECLDSIKQLDYPNFEIVVLDNDSRDGSREIVKKYSGIKLVLSDNNLGFSGGQISALDSCDGDYIALVNSDAIVDSKWLIELMEVFENYHRVGAAGGKSYLWDGKTKSEKFYSFHEVNPFTAGTRHLSYDLNRIQTVPSLSGSAVVISRSAIDELGYFDNDFFAYYEETDLFARMHRYGYDVVYNPKAFVWHQVAATLGSKSFTYLYLMNKNRAFFALRNFDKAYLRVFLNKYVKSELRNMVSSLIKPGDEKKARRKALWWNVRHVFKTLGARSKIVREGEYNTKISKLISPSVSVIITNYNYEKYLGQAINSALEQTIKPNEVIVIDDGSTDSSKKIIEEFGHQIKPYFIENGGVVKAKNFGIKKASGEWLLFLDADDYLETNYIEKCYLEWLKAGGREDIGFIYTSAKLFGSKSGILKAHKYSFRRLRRGNYIHNSALISKDLMDSVGGYSDDMSVGYEDWDLYIALAEKGSRGLLCKTTHLNYRRHNVSSRNDSAERNAEQINELIRSRHSTSYDGYDHFRLKLKNSIIGKSIIKAKAIARYIVKGDFDTIGSKLKKRTSRRG